MKRTKRVLLLSIAVSAAILLYGVPQRGQEPAKAPDFGALSTKTDVMIPTRDGVKLHTEIYTPKNATEALPFFLTRTPYGLSDDANGNSQLLNLYREMFADGYIFVRGRLKEIINRGGEKISPGEIDAVLLSNPKVLDAESFGESDAIYGENVQAAVILRPGMEATEGELRDYCRTRLSAFEVPERIYIVADFPRTAKGSTDRRALAEQFTAGGGSEPQ